MNRVHPAIWLLAVAGALSVDAGARATLPRIDPSGRHLFVCDPPAAPAYKPEPGCPTHKNAMLMRLTPAKVIAPVGAEVVLLAAVCGPDGYMWAHQRVEWMISPGGVGQFVDLGDRGWLDVLRGPDNRPRKIDNAYAIGTTSPRYVMLTRGTPVQNDDVPVQRGQAWVTVTSPVEGASYVTAFAPSIYEWGQRKQTATIYWVNAQWAFPPPANNPVGTRHVFTTTVSRQTDNSPLVGWIVRYQITGGPAAGFAPDGSQVVEMPTNALGQASAEIVQQQPAAGTNTISIQVIRPAELSGGYGQRLVVGSGAVTKTWSTATSIALRTTGPAQATVGSVLNYRVELSNPGPLSARGIVVTNPIPPGLSFVSSNPPAQPQGDRLEWRIGDLPAGQSLVLDIDMRADRAGTFSNCAILAAADGVSAQSCATTTVLGAATPSQSITLDVTGPPTAAVGQTVRFAGTVRNRGTTPTGELVVVDRFDAGLQHETRTSPIERNIGVLQPGESREIEVLLSVRQPGQLCNTMEIHDSAGVRATGRSCVTAGAAAPAQPPPEAARPTITVRKTGPDRMAVGQTAEFVLEIRNTGQVPVTQLRIVDSYDRSLDAVMASPDHTRDGDDLIWLQDRLPPGQAVTYRIQCRCLAPGDRVCNRLRVTTAEGVTATDEACLQITPAAAQPPVAPPPVAPPAGAGQLTMAVVNLGDPVSVGRTTTYEVRITNRGMAPDRQVTLAATVPAEMTPQAVGTAGPSQPRIEGNVVRFAPVTEIGPGETLTYQIQVRADRPGQARFGALVTSAAMPGGVRGDETTTIFAQ